MDLSHSGMFEKVKDTFQAQNRGGYKQWFNPVYADPNKNTRLRPTKTNAMLFAEDKDDDDDEDLEPREDDDDNDDQELGNQNEISQELREAHDADEAADGALDDSIDPALRGTGPRAPAAAAAVTTTTATKAASRAPSATPQAVEDQQRNVPGRLRNLGEIQVLDLHSDNPIISYKGRIFSGSWASNIGTEMIFGAHEEVADRGLPYLRALPGGVDLMAASSARILTTPADLRPKNRSSTSATSLNPQSRKPAPDRYRQLRKESNIEIPIAFDKHGRRKPQARFLENLMAIKRSRGERDEATTVTKDTTRDYVDQEEDPEEASLQKKRARDRRRQQRLMEERANRPPKRRRGGNRWARNRVVSFTDKDTIHVGATPADGNGLGNEGGGSSSLSSRTPATWAALEGAGDAGDKADA